MTRTNSMVMMGDDGGLAQGRVTQNVGEQQHLARSDKFQLEWLAIQISGDHGCLCSKTLKEEGGSGGDDLEVVQNLTVLES